MITTDRISRALGDAVVRVWGRLPHDLQSPLFDEVVAENEEMKGHLAVLLHEKHSRYCRARFIGRLGRIQ
jgi:hypothetical protein